MIEDQLEQSESNFDYINPMKHPPYHLRTNKAVDRLLLVDILRKLRQPDYKEITYYSLAGPFLEDLRVMDHFFPEMKLVSLESNEQTFKRQSFNRFSSRLDLRHKTLADFLIHDYRPSNCDVFWLDYTDLKYERFDEFQSVLNRVLPGSVVRITLRAEPEVDVVALKDRLSTEELNRLLGKLERTFKDEFARVLPHGESLVSTAFIKPPEFARMVQLMIRRAASTALDKAGSKVDFLSLQSTRYNDNTQMVSVTGIICLRSDSEIRERLQSIRFANFDWHEPDRIDIPALSVKERLHLERYLPVLDGQDAGETLFEALQYMIENGAKRSKQQLSHYADCHRDYPNFVRISL